MEYIDISARRILTLIMKSKKMENYAYSNDPDLKAHAQITRQSASEGMVLLKNNATLPINEATNLALLGVTSYDFIAGGTGSGDVNEAYTISLEQGLTNAGFQVNKKAKSIFEKLKVANEEAFEKPEGLDAMLTPYTPPEMDPSEEDLKAIAEESEIGIITIGRNSGEGGDRVEKDDFLLSEVEQRLVSNSCEAFHALGKKVIVVLNIGGVIETASWKGQPDAILLAWQGGQEGGNSVADILKGTVNPSGKLPMTFPIHLDDHASNEHFPLGGAKLKMTDLFFQKAKEEGEELIPNIDVTTYAEGIYVGYRHFDKKNIAVSFPFGYGLSYTEFSYTDLEVLREGDSLNISLTIQNTGNTAGKEVAQIYVSKENSNVDRPIQELKAFAKTSLLEAGASQILSFSIPITELAYWDESNSAWAIETGTYVVKASSSSRSIKAQQPIEL